MKTFRILIVALAFIILFVALGKLCETLPFMFAFTVAFLAGGGMSTVFWILLEYE